MNKLINASKFEWLTDEYIPNTAITVQSEQLNQDPSESVTYVYDTKAIEL